MNTKQTKIFIVTRSDNESNVKVIHFNRWTVLCISRILYVVFQFLSMRPRSLSTISTGCYANARQFQPVGRCIQAIIFFLNSHNRFSSLIFHLSFDIVKYQLFNSIAHIVQRQTKCKAFLILNTLLSISTVYNGNARSFACLCWRTYSQQHWVHIIARA